MGPCEPSGRRDRSEFRVIESIFMDDEAKETDERTELGPIATRVVYEDERVRVWDQVIAPGQSTGPHVHELPYALVTVEGSSLDVAPVPGYRAMHSDEIPSVEIESQTAAVLPSGSVEEAVNTGDQTYHAILVEFKER